MKKFTQGFWYLSHSPARKNDAGRVFKSIKNQKTIGGQILANAYGYTVEEAEANAKLIAASPKLLEAAEMCIELMEAKIDDKKVLPFDEVMDRLNLIKSAIKIATE